MDKTFEDLIQELQSKGLDFYFLADKLKSAHNRELQSLRERVSKLEDQLHDNGLEVED